MPLPPPRAFTTGTPPAPRYHHSAVVYGSSMFVFGERRLPLSLGPGLCWASLSVPCPPAHVLGRGPLARPSWSPGGHRLPLWPGCCPQSLEQELMGCRGPGGHADRGQIPPPPPGLQIKLTPWPVGAPCSSQGLHWRHLLQLEPEEQKRPL